MDSFSLQLLIDFNAMMKVTQDGTYIENSNALNDFVVGNFNHHPAIAKGSECITGLSIYKYKHSQARKSYWIELPGISIRNHQAQQHPTIRSRHRRRANETE